MKDTIPAGVAAVRPSKLQSTAAKVLLLLVTAGVCLLLMEFGVRLLFPFYNPATQVPLHFTTNGIALGTPLQTARLVTPKGDYDLLIRFNEDGFRDSKNLREATEADWFAVGDSYTMGWGVQEAERFSSQLEQSLKTNGLKARVFNIAIPDNIIGYQLLLKYAESRGPKVRHLIVGVCMENDLKDYTDGKSDWDPGFKPAEAVPLKETLRYWFKRHSALYTAISFSAQRLPLAKRFLERVGVARDIYHLTGRNEWNEKVLQTSSDELAKLVAGRAALVLIIPSRFLWQGSNQATEKRIHEAFVRMLRERGLHVVDVKDALEATGNPLNCYFKSDSHWNAKGHTIAAGELFKAIQAGASSN